MTGFVSGDPITVAGEPGHYIRPVPDRPEWAWIMLPGHGNVTDVFMVHVDTITPRPKATT